MSAAPLRVRGLAKAYGTHRVLEGIDLEVEGGAAVALVGPNGAGKSTLLGCLCGAVIADAGTIEIAGHDLVRAPLAARAALRYLPQEVEVPDGLTGHELLRFYAEVFGAAGELAGAAARSGLGEALSRLASSYSVGMRRRLAFAASLLGTPRLVVLDEPFAGVDHEGRIRMRKALAELLTRGAGLLVAAHDRDLEDLAELAPRMLELGRPRAAELASRISDGA